MPDATEPAAGPGRRMIVVIGASAGGVETLVRVVKGLPPDLPAAVCVVLHLAPGSPSALPAILQRAGMLPCHSAVDGDTLRDGEILVAPPDRHLALTDGRVELTVGPRENGHRPAVDVLFRTAAAAADSRVIGVILSGTRDDGTAGLAMIKARGGLAIVQDPADALYPGMPASALSHVAVDLVLPSDQIADTIVRIVNGDLDPIGSAADPGTESAAQSGSFTSTCPDCGGVLSEHRDAGVTQWRCRVGHRYSPESLVDAQAQGVEAALWAAVRALDDRQSLLRRIADNLIARGHTRSAETFHDRAREAWRQAEVVRGALRDAAATTLQRAEDSEIVEEERRGVA